MKTYKHYYIYQIKNLLNGRCYIGWHATNKAYDSYFGSGLLLKRDIKKYGQNNFVKGILEFCKEDEVFEKEIHWIDKLKTHISEGGYNLTRGGDGGDTFSYKTPEEKQATNTKRGLSLSGKNNGMYAKTVYDVWLEKHGKEEADKKYADYKNNHAHTGTINGMHGRSIYDVWVEKYGKEEADKKYIEYKKKLSDKRKQIKQTQETKDKIGKANAISLLGKKQSQETIDKRVKKLKGQKRNKH
jgi:hypothetical protein